MEIKLNIPFSGLQIQSLYPFILDGADVCFRRHFSADIHTFYQAGVQIFPQRNRADQGRTKYLPVFDRRFQKSFQANIGHLLIFNGDADMDVFPAIAPVIRDAQLDSLRPFGGHDESAVVSPPDISQQPSRHISASSIKKSEEKHSLITE